MYKLELTKDDVKTIDFVGHRYFWSDALTSYEPGTVEFKEHEAWELVEEFHKDTEGGHSYFPMLDLNSELADKLFKFIDGVV